MQASVNQSPSSFTNGSGKFLEMKEIPEKKNITSRNNLQTVRADGYWHVFRQFKENPETTLNHELIPTVSIFIKHVEEVQLIHNA